MRLKSKALRPRTRGAVCTSALAIALGALMPVGAGAQTVAGRSEPQDSRTDGDIVVTGSRVVREGETATPVMALSEQQLQDEAPSNNIADILHQLPAVAGSTSLDNSRTNLSDGSAGINTINLRNLGSLRTLVLLDGRRSVSSTVNGFVDVNTFPQALVKRVEVVTGGASAAYGSDAVAGVVNFILDKDYEGLKAAGSSGITDKGDRFNYNATLSAGKSFAGGRGHLLLNGEIARRDGVFTADRDWNRLGYRTITNVNATATNGQPANLVVFGAGTSNQLPGGIITASTAVAGSGVAANSLRGIYFGQGGSVNQYTYGSLNSSSVTQGGDWELSDIPQRLGLAAQEDRRGVFGRISFEVAPWIELFAQGSYNWQETLFNAGSSQTVGGTAGTLQADNAYLINALGASRLAGIRTVTIGTTGSDLPQRKSNNRRDTQRYVVGAGGSFPLFGRDAVWDVFAQYGETNTREQLRDVMISARMALAVDAVFARAGNALGVPAGTIVCRSTLTDPTNGCVPLNRLGIGVASEAALDYVLGDPFREQTFRQTNVGLNLSTTPFATWAGDVSVALGGEYREDRVSGYVPAEFQSGYSVGNFLPTFGRNSVKEAYLETVVPVGLGLELNGAVRATDYSNSGYVTTWKVGGVWQPIPDVRLRMTVSRDIRAPNLNELFQAGTSRSNTLTDRRTTPARQGVTFRELTTGNLDLRPEKANSLTVGGVIQPHFLRGLSLSADYFQVKLRDRIGQYDSQDIVDRCADGLQDFCAAITPDPLGIRELFIRASYFNFARHTVRGVDLVGSYTTSADWLAGPSARLTLRGTGTRYIDNIIDTGIAGDVPVNTVGSNGAGSSTPTWIFRASASLDTPAFRISAVGRGVSAGTYSNSYIECQTNCPASTAVATTTDNNHVSGVFYADLTLTAKVGKGRRKDELFLAITNLFDRWPILLPEGGLPANTTYSNLLGRSYRVGFRLRL